MPVTTSRRRFLGWIGAAPFLSVKATAGPEEAPAGPFQLPPLLYDAAALEPHIDAATMRLHHDRHHAAYVENLNRAVAAHPELRDRELEDLLRNLDGLPEPARAAVRNNGGGHYNHTMFWRIMGPQAGGAPNGAVASALNRSFGSFDRFRELFNQAGERHFGSGWVWLARTPDGMLQIRTTVNQDNPLMRGGATPILGNDLWEHAYYLKYQNRRADYLGAWWNVVNWEEVNRRFQSA